MASKDRDRYRVRLNRLGIDKTFPKGTPKKVVDEYKFKKQLGAIDGTLVRANTPTLTEYAKRFQEAYPTVRKRSDSTRLKDQFTLRDHILPRFGEKKITEVEASDVLAWQVDLAKRLAPQTVNNIVACLSSVYRLAVLEGKAKYNPCASVPRVPRPKPRPVFWTPEEASRFLAYARENDWAVYQVVLLAICSGIRPGEMMGLQRDCLDFERGQIDNRRHFCTKKKRVVDGLKNGPGYKVPVPRMVFDVLEEKRGLKSDELVFPWLSKQRAFGWLTLRPMAEAAKVRYIGFHKLRHTFASHLRFNGKSLMEIRDLLGHHTVKSTEIYSHLIDGVQAGATDCIANGLGGAAFTGGNVATLRGSRR